MFFRFKLFALVVLASTAIVSVQAHNGEHEHGNGVAMSVTGGSGTTIFNGENQTPTADLEREGQADDGAESETRSYKRDRNERSADIELGDEASEVVESESLRESDSVLVAADSELDDESDDGVEGESRSRKRDKRDARRNLRVQLA